MSGPGVCVPDPLEIRKGEFNIEFLTLSLYPPVHLSVVHVLRASNWAIVRLCSLSREILEARRFDLMCVSE